MDTEDRAGIRKNRREGWQRSPGTDTEMRQSIVEQLKQKGGGSYQIAAST